MKGVKYEIDRLFTKPQCNLLNQTPVFRWMCRLCSGDVADEFDGSTLCCDMLNEEFRVDNLELCVHSPNSIIQYVFCHKGTNLRVCYENRLVFVRDD